MRPSARIAAVIELLEMLYHTWQEDRQMPMDVMMGQYFRARRYIGSKDRAFIGEMTYGILRHGGALEWHVERAGVPANPRSVTLAALGFFYDSSPLEIQAMFSGEAYSPPALSREEIGLITNLDKVNYEDETMPLPAKYNFPAWMEGRLQQTFGASLGEALGALNHEAPVDLRVNTLKCPSREDLIYALDKEGFLAMPTPHSPLGVRLNKRIPAFTTQAFSDGWFEMQDEGSQICAALVQAVRGEKVIDFCAGAGGKTLAMAAAMENKGRILAFDTSAKRLKQLPKRLARAGVDNVMIKPIAHENDALVKRHRSSADWVLVDAPCSGSGTWRRNPDLKWRLSAHDLAELKDLQRRILAAASTLVKPGGALVYVTCSVFADENEHQLVQFLMDYPEFRVAEPEKLWDRFCQPLSEAHQNAPIIRLSPHKDGTDGFFAAILRKKA